jgi:hypothetical protein
MFSFAKQMSESCSERSSLEEKVLRREPQAAHLNLEHTEYRGKATIARFEANLAEPSVKCLASLNK